MKHLLTKLQNIQNYIYTLQKKKSQQQSITVNYYYPHLVQIIQNTITASLAPGSYNMAYKPRMYHIFWQSPIFVNIIACKTTTEIKFYTFEWTVS